MAAAVTAGDTALRRIVVATDASPAAAPCGACRQVLAEFGPDLLVTAVGAGDERNWSLRELLPDAFGPGALA